MDWRWWLAFNSRVTKKYHEVWRRDVRNVDDYFKPWRVQSDVSAVVNAGDKKQKTKTKTKTARQQSCFESSLNEDN